MRSRIAALTALVAILLPALFASAAADDGLRQFMLRGWIYGDDYKPIDSASVTSLTLNDTVPVSFRLLTGNDTTGLLAGSELRALVSGGTGDYTIVIEKDGYEPVVKNFKVASVSQDIIYLRDLLLKTEMKRELDEVTVSATRIKMVMKGDTMVFDAGAFNLETGSMLDALVRQLPGTTLDADGVITVNGRKINELLLNGKDFFSGDPKVALQNLPAFTVKNIKVYDKAAKDAYLTHSDARLASREEDENLVMDVNLKKEYNDGYTANAEAGYGTHDRYMGRAFGLGYTPRFRVSAFVNANNIGDESSSGVSGNWQVSSGNQNGTQRRLKTGIDFSAFRDNEKIELWGNFVYTRERIKNRSISASTNFYPEQDIYGRSVGGSGNVSHTIDFRPSLRLIHDNYYVTFQPSVLWTRQETTSSSRSATFTEAPDESYRGEAVDSIFASRAGGTFTRYMLTRLQQMSASQRDDFQGNFWASGTVRPPTWKGSLSLTLSAGYSSGSTDSRRYYSQRFGPQSTSTGRPVDTDRFSDNTLLNRNITANVSYSRNNRKFGEVYTTNIRYSIGASGRHVHGDNTTLFYTDSVLPDPLTPPSAVIGAMMSLDPLNSPRTKNNLNQGTATATLAYSREATAPGDSTLNLGFTMTARMSYEVTGQDYSLSKPEQETRSIDRTTGFLTPQISFSISSPNKVRNFFATFSYNIQTSAPSLSMLMPNVNTSNPLVVVLTNPDGLRNSRTHSLQANFSRMSRGEHHQNFSFFASWRIMTDAIAQAMRYDPSTGVTVHYPANISGNWNVDMAPSFSFSAGKRQQTSVRFMMQGIVNNSADYTAINAEPQRSSVLSMTLRPSASVDYQTKKGSTVTAGLTTAIGHQQSARENFNNQTWYEIWPFVKAFLKLPASFELNTQFNPYFRRGYSDRTMNTTEYVWNATLVKSFARPAITLKLTGHDILGSAKHVYTSVNAQGRTETWSYTMPRFVMLTVGYRFDMKPRNEREHRP